MAGRPADAGRSKCVGTLHRQRSRVRKLWRPCCSSATRGASP